MALMVLGLVFAGELLGSVNVGQTLGDSEIWAPSIILLSSCTTFICFHKSAQSLGSNHRLPTPDRGHFLQRYKKETSGDLQLRPDGRPSR